MEQNYTDKTRSSLTLQQVVYIVTAQRLRLNTYA